MTDRSERVQSDPAPVLEATGRQEFFWLITVRTGVGLSTQTGTITWFPGQTREALYNSVLRHMKEYTGRSDVVTLAWVLEPNERGDR
ncbi:hypothetical protein [Streptomyces antimicrobicus]|uniref:Uncharacterized protein n=1 Tax=Streptomyces antimicrobicus TaxID=2883108 RepID=A0ABS8BAF0_9ACTN|nr:hypothetical protein [Streptomyces antimicrobicus]MCB5181494.1 hypothetical protein [Streptomyces antimicrobicus]